MQEKDQIAELFKETFNNYEAPVRPELWSNIASQIQAPVASSAAAQAGTVAGKISGSILSWVAGAAIVVSAAAGYIYYSGNKEVKKSEQPVVVTQTAPAVSETEQNSHISGSENAITPNQVTVPSANNNTPGSHSNQKISSDPQENSTSLNTENSVTAAPSQNKPADQHAVTSAPAPQVKEIAPGTSDIPSVHPPANTDAQLSKVKAAASATSGYAPFEVTFHGSENGEWQFGDGSESIKGTHVTHTFTTPGNYLVTFRNMDASGKTYSDLVKIEVLSDLSISGIPNIFTPNGDGVNDVFKISTDKDIDIETSIFNKSGKLVYRFTGAENGWNGKLNNMQEAESGTYFYVIFATGKNGAKNTQKGTITLIR